jgi:peptidoglycan/xylan/chitin deacetylase (PgdA/CDA1 family)
LYGIKATFFLNGEFMRRNPGATRMIAESGHEVGNMFFSTFDPTDSRYRIDAEFIQRGLARTEDDYFDITGKELSLIWHTPHYTANSLILEAAAKMNYTYIGRDIDPLDWVGRLAGSRTPGLYLPSHLLVERISETVRPGSIIPIRLGLPDAGREDYLFNELPLLINALISDGYAIVPVSSLLEHAY